MSSLTIHDVKNVHMTAPLKHNVETVEYTTVVICIEQENGENFHVTCIGDNINDSKIRTLASV